MKRIILPLLAASVLFVGCSQHHETLPAEKSVTAQPLSKGQQLFLSNCVTCHQGMGDPPGPNAVVLDSSTLSNEESFIALVRQPKSAMMRAFSPEELSDADVKEIYKYLVSAKTPAAAH
jgi:mono/diheme cytochrome c family protein